MTLDNAAFTIVIICTHAYKEKISISIFWAAQSQFRENTLGTEKRMPIIKSQKHRPIWINLSPDLGPEEASNKWYQITSIFEIANKHMSRNNGDYPEEAKYL